MKATRTIGLLLAGVLVFAGCTREDTVGEGVAVEEEVGAGVADAGIADGAGFGEWDVDQDARLAANEFGARVQREGVFTRWNRNADLGLDANEFGEGAFGLWDRDRNNQIAEAEWREGVGAWFPAGATYGTFTDWDANRDNFLDTTELGAGFERYGLFDSWDVNDNQFIEEDEFSGGYFGVFDTNDDTFLDENEWRTGAGLWDAGVV